MILAGQGSHLTGHEGAQHASCADMQKGQGRVGRAHGEHAWAEACSGSWQGLAKAERLQEAHRLRSGPTPPVHAVCLLALMGQ